MWRIAAIILLTPVLLLFLVIILILIPPIQQKAISIATEYLSDATDMNISIGHLGIKPSLDFSLREVLATERENGDTILWVDKMQLSVDRSALLNKVITVKAMGLYDVNANTYGLIDGISIAGKIGELYLRSDSTIFRNDNINTILNEIRLNDSRVSIVLSESDTIEADTASSAIPDWHMDVRNVVIDNVDVSVSPPDLNAHIGHLNTTAVISLADFLYDVRTLSLTGSAVSVSGEDIILNELSAIAVIDSSCITVPQLHLDASESILQAGLIADINARLNLESLLLECSGDIGAFGSRISLSASYDIDDEEYDADIDIGNIVISEIVPLDDICMFDGHIKARGKGIDIFSKSTSVSADILADSCRYGAVRAYGTSLKAKLESSSVSGRTGFDVLYSDSSTAVSAQGDVTFALAGWTTPMPDFTVAAKLKDLNLRIDSDSVYIPKLTLNTSTDRHSGSIDLEMPGVSLTAETGSHLLSVPSAFSALAAQATLQYDSLDFDISTLKAYFPELAMKLAVTPDNPFHEKMQGLGLDFLDVTAALSMSPSDGIRADADVTDFSIDTFTVSRTSVRIRQEESVMNCTADLTFNEQHSIPSFTTRLDANIGVHESDAHLVFRSDIENGILSVSDVSGDVNLDLNGKLVGNSLNVAGALDLKDLRYGQFALGDRTIDLGFISRDESGRYSATADIADFPLSIFTASVEMPGLETDGRVDGHIVADIDSGGVSLRGEVLPKDVRASLSPYGVELALAEVPILFRDMKVVLDGMTIYGSDSTSLNIDGAFDVDRMYADITAASDAFKPATLAKNDSLPLYGNIEAGIKAHIRGPVDSLSIHSDINILPVTDITYLIDSKNSAYAKASGLLALDITPDGSMSADGTVSVTDGEVRYSPQYYPLEPFSIADGSNIRFDGDITKPILDITATQSLKANVKTNGVPRTVDFIVGLKIENRIDSLQLGFIIDAPNDRAIHDELATYTDDERGSIAAAMLATGMYVTDYNEAAMSSSYALISIMQSRLNAIATNRMRGKALDIDFGITDATRNNVMSTDYSVKLSREFFDDRLKVTVGGRISDKQNSSVSSFIDDLQLQWQLKPKGNTYLRLFHKSDFQNIIDGELLKDGIGVLHSRRWEPRGNGNGATTSFEGNFSHRSNYQIGPEVSATITKDNMFGWGETFSGSIRGAYFWNYKNNSMSERSNTDSYHFGADMELLFPRLLLPWKSEMGAGRSPSTRIGLGYMFENIAGGYKMNEISVGLSYQSRLSKYVTHSFSPFSLSVIRSSSDNISDEIIKEILDNKSLVKNFVKDEFVPAMQYSISYNNNADRARSVNTRLDATIKESGNLISGIQALCGKDFRQRGKGFIFDNYSQFLKFNVELRNRFNLTEKSTLATRLLLGSVLSYGNSFGAPLSEAFYSGGPSSIRAFASRSLGPGNYHSTDSGNDPYFFHGGETRFEMNAEYRFPLVWMLEGAVFVDAGNVWNNEPIDYGLGDEEREMLRELLDIWDINPDFDGSLNSNFLNETALGTGFGVRFVYQSLVVRLDLGIALHAPYDTGKSGFYNIPSFWKDGVRLNFAIGYPF